MRSIPVQALQQRQIQNQMAMVQPRNPARGTSASLKNADDFRIPQIASQLAKVWQVSAYDYSTSIGQIGKVHNKTANKVASGELKPVWTDPETGNERTLDEILDEKTEDLPAGLREEAEGVRRVHNAFIGPIGGQAELLRKAALQLRIGGETFLVATPSITAEEEEIEPDEDSPELLWEFLSPIEIQPDKYGGIERSRTGIGIAFTEKLTDRNYIARCWVSSAERSEEPECAMRRVVSDCRSYIKLRTLIDASADSRIPAGVFKIPEDLEVVGMPQDSDDGEEQAALPFSTALVKHLKAAFTNPESAARLIPLFAVGEPEALEGLGLVDLGEEQNATWASALRNEVLNYIIQSLDEPPEAIMGKAEVNHWTGTNVDDEHINDSVIPLGGFIAAFCTVSYLQAMLERFEQMDDTVAANWRYVYDATNLTARADAGVTAMRLGERDLLSDEAQVLANNFQQSDMPTEEELREKRIWRLIMAEPSYAPQLLPLISGLEDVELEAVAAPSPNVEPGLEEEPSGISGGDPRSGGDAPSVDMPPTQTPRTPPGSPAPVSSDAALIQRILGAADATMERALERAGARAVSRLNMAKTDSSKLAAADRLRSSDKRQVLALLSSSDLTALNLTPAQLLDGAWDEFLVKAAGWIQPWVVAKTGRNGSWSADTSQAVATELCGALHTLALSDRGARTYEDGLRVPEELVVRALETVGMVSR